MACIPAWLNALRRYAIEGTFVLGLRKSGEARGPLRCNVTIELSRAAQRLNGGCGDTRKGSTQVLVNAGEAPPRRAVEKARAFADHRSALVFRRSPRIVVARAMRRGARRARIVEARGAPFSTQRAFRRAVASAHASIEFFLGVTVAFLLRR